MNDSAGVFAPSHRAISIGILLSITAIACEGMAVATVLPSVAADLGGFEGYGWAFSAFMLASLVGAISAGHTADARGPRAPARLGFASFSLGLVVASLAPAWPMFLVGRAFQGFGAGGIIAVAYVAVVRAYPEELRPRLLALNSSAWILPALIGPAVAGLVAEHASWRLVFVGILPAVAIGAWMLVPSLSRLSTAGAGAVPQPGRVTAAAVGDAPDGVVDSPRIAPNAAGRGRVLAALRLTVGISLVLLAVSLPVVPAAIVVGALGIVLAGPALRNLLPRGTLFARRGLPAAVAVRGLLAFGFFGGEALIPLGLSTERGVPPSLVGLSLTAGALAWVLGSWVQDHAEAASGGSVPRRAIRATGGLLFIAAGIGSAAAVIVSPALPLELVVLAWAVGGLGMGVTYPAITLTALGMASSGAEGSAAASLQVAETIGTSLGTGAAGALLAWSVHLERSLSEGLAWGFLLAVVAILVAVVPAARLAPGLPRAARWRPTPSA